MLLAQINPIVGSVSKNLRKIKAICDKASQDGHKIVVFPELSLVGYPPEDLLFFERMHQEVQEALHELLNFRPDLAIVLGHPEVLIEALPLRGHAPSPLCWNALSVIHQGKRHVYAKQCLPNYRVFDEVRYFKAGADDLILEVNGEKVGFLICEDLWYEEPAKRLADLGAETIVSIHASPFFLNKFEARYKMVSERAKSLNVSILYVNQVGGQDELIFDGGSFAVNQKGELEALAPFFAESQTTWERKNPAIVDKQAVSEAEQIRGALVLGIRDYVTKSGFKQVVLGLSGGIDSAVTLALAVEALGSQNVTAIMMPSRYTSEMSLVDAEQIAKNCGVRYLSLPIDDIFESYLKPLKPHLNDKPGITEQNLQARIRGTILMALSNQEGSLVLTTGNKSEMAVGYATLYGDMVGAYAVLKDLLKRQVYELANDMNQKAVLIPERIITRPPSAELAPDQKDEDSLPPYAILDELVSQIVGLDRGPRELIEQGFDEEIVHRTIQLIARNEYKRQQSAPGPRISNRAFGKDWRMPIVQQFW